MKFINFENCPYGSRHGRYGGNAGNKDGIIFNNENWIIKYPKTTKYMRGKNLPSYTSSPLSEYIGSQIYAILGYPVHETLLGIRDKNIVVACKDFQKHYGDLAEIRTIKNGANKEIEEYTNHDIPMSATGDNVILEELLLHFKVNPLLQNVDVKKRFFDQAVIDILIDNNDRNNGNWGLLYSEEKKAYELAPIYDNGNSFYNKADDEKIKRYLENIDEIALSGSTAYSYREHILSAKSFLDLDFPELKRAISEVVPNIRNNMDRIITMIEEIPAQIQDDEGVVYSVCSEERKEVYISCMKIRLEKLLIPKT